MVPVSDSKDATDSEDESAEYARLAAGIAQAKAHLDALKAKRPIVATRRPGRRTPSWSAMPLRPSTMRAMPPTSIWGRTRRCCPSTTLPCSVARHGRLHGPGEEGLGAKPRSASGSSTRRSCPLRRSCGTGTTSGIPGWASSPGAPTARTALASRCSSSRAERSIGHHKGVPRLHPRGWPVRGLEAHHRRVLGYQPERGHSLSLAGPGLRPEHQTSGAACHC